MRFPFLAVCLMIVLSIISVRAQAASKQIKVVGLIDLPNWRRAILERPTRYHPEGETTMLTQGERNGALEMVEINPDQRTVKVNVAGTEDPVLLSMAEPSGSASQVTGKKTLMLAEIDLHSLLDLYGQLKGKIILRHPRLRTDRFSLIAVPADKPEAAAELERVLAQRQIVCIKDGEKFMMVVPKSEEGNVHPGSPPPETVAGVGTNRTDGAAILGPGFIDFRRMDLDNVACFYAELVGGKPDREGHVGFGSEPIILQTVIAITADDAKYALDTLFAWRGVKAVRGADDTIRLERLEQK